MLNSLFNVLQDLWAIIFSLLASLVLGFIFSLTFVKIKKNDGRWFVWVRKIMIKKQRKKFRR